MGYELFFAGMTAGAILGIVFTELVHQIEGYLAFSNKEEEEETEEVSDEELIEDEDLEEEDEMTEKPSLEEVFFPRIALAKKRARAEAERKARLEARKGPEIIWIDL